MHHKMLFAAIAAALLISIAMPAVALDIVYVDYFTLGRDTFYDTDLEAHSQGLDAFLFLPIKFITLGAVYELRDYDWHNQSQRISRNQLPDQLQMTMFSVGTLLDLNQRWKLLVRFDPGIASDFRDISIEDFYFRGYGVALFSYSKELSLMFGGGYTDQYEAPSPVPILGFDWRPTKDVQLSLMIPDRFHFRFAINDRFWPGIRGCLRGYSFRLSEDQPFDGSRIHRRELRLGPILDVRIVADLFFGIEAGAIVFNEFDIYDKHNRRIHKGDRAANWFAQAGLYYRFDLANLEKN
ncbi:MAG: DUF6268 family outer membrane beta-barrel protein [Candidatus Alcyoniella australis]|nr:DUF6268 family outer membrane beta-barrel protein [Candidatus Alcyoniella australis]